jgi:hypothetical protein
MKLTTPIYQDNNQFFKLFNKVIYMKPIKCVGITVLYVIAAFSLVITHLLNNAFTMKIVSIINKWSV